jgi:hypothetical protein
MRSEGSVAGCQMLYCVCTVLPFVDTKWTLFVEHPVALWLPLSLCCAQAVRVPSKSLVCFCFVTLFFAMTVLWKEFSSPADALPSCPSPIFILQVINVVFWTEIHLCYFLWRKSFIHWNVNPFNVLMDASSSSHLKYLSAILEIEGVDAGTGLYTVCEARGWYELLSCWLVCFLFNRSRVRTSAAFSNFLRPIRANKKKWCVKMGHDSSLLSLGVLYVCPKRHCRPVRLFQHCPRLTLLQKSLLIT